VSGNAATPQLAGAIVEQSFASAARELAYDAYLPSGYADSTERYPVIHYLHRLRAGPAAFRRFVYVAKALKTDDLAAIVVAAQSRDHSGS
jgi:hypothetical protein